LNRFYLPRRRLPHCDVVAAIPQTSQGQRALEKDRAYFRETREKRLGATLEAVTAGRETNVVVFRKTLEPLRTKSRWRPI
jgi:hypothetical protein